VLGHKALGACTHLACTLYSRVACTHALCGRAVRKRMVWQALHAMLCCVRYACFVCLGWRACQTPGEVTVKANARGRNGSAMRRFCKRRRQATLRTAQPRAPYSSMVKTSSAPMWGTARRCWCQKLGTSPRAKRWRRSTNLNKLPRLTESVHSAAR